VDNYYIVLVVAVVADDPFGKVVEEVQYDVHWLVGYREHYEFLGGERVVEFAGVVGIQHEDP
jgi:hypothetical protein